MLPIVCKTLVVLAVACICAGQGYGGGYGGGAGGYGGGHGGGYAPKQYYAEPAYNYGPDNALYHYYTYHYDPYFYKNANVKFQRYPGGAAYTVNEEGKGSNVNVNVETFRAGYKGY